LVSGGIVFDTGETLAKTGLSISSPLNAFIVSTADTEHNGAILKLAASVSQQYRTDRKLLLQYSDLQFTGSNVYTVGEQNLQSLQFVAGTSVGFFNGTQVLSGTTAGQTVTEFRLGNTGSFGLDGKINEVIIYNSDQSANRTAIEANIGETYGITGIPAYDNTVDGFVETWYDQSGNGNDATQSVAGNQPKIVDGGVLVSGGIDFDGVGDALDTPSLITSVDLASSFVVAKQSSSHTGAALALSRNNPNQRWYSPIYVSGSAYFGYGDSATKVSLGISDTSEYLFASIADGINATGYVNSVSKGTSAVFTGLGTLSSGGIGSVNVTSFFLGTIAEIIVYNSDQSANRVAIETNINDHYNIY
jgi:hypothetical protein